MNLRIEDEPLGYQPSRGQRISFQMSYRQRGTQDSGLSEEIFGIGKNWSCSWGIFLKYYGNGAVADLKRPGTGFLRYDTTGVPNWRDKTRLTATFSGGIVNGFTLDYPSGAQAVINKLVTLSDGSTCAFITSFSDPAGNTTTFAYDASSAYARLSSVTDPDSQVTSLYYTNALLTNRITSVTDPYSRTMHLQYDSDTNSLTYGMLTNVVDVAGLASSFTYDSYIASIAGVYWITNMATPYGSTSFRYDGDAYSATTEGHIYVAGNNVSRLIEITEPNGSRQLYLHRYNCTELNPTNSTVFLPDSYSSGLVPDTTGAGFSFPNTFGNNPAADSQGNFNQAHHNSFHWGRLQYSALGAYKSSHEILDLTLTDYKFARMRHWLGQRESNDGVELGDTLSLERAPSPDGSTDGQMTWYDYDGKDLGVNIQGTNAFPSFVAIVLPRWHNTLYPLSTQRLRPHYRRDLHLQQT